MQASTQARHFRLERARVLGGAVAAGFSIVVVGLVHLQVAQHDEYVRLAKENHVRLEVLRAPRGAIYDRKGRLLADSAPSFSVVFRPFPAESVEATRRLRTGGWLGRVSSVMGMDSAQVMSLVLSAEARGQTVTLRRNAPFAVRAAVEETREELPGLDVLVEPLRRYPHGTLAAHLLGYAGEINDVELDSLAVEGYRPGDLIGRSGIERSYEELLRGRDGAEFVVVNAGGQRVSTLSEGPPRPPVAGHDLVLTLDLDVQLALENAMAGVERGAAVALDPRDGGVLGLVSRPVFDPNEFSIGITRERWRELASGGANPLLNRAIQGLYPPGSTFKVVTMLAALRSGVARPQTRLVPCPGHWTFGGRRFGCWKHEGHGSLDFVSALEHSCDVYFYQIGTRLGLDRLEEAGHALGLGERTGIDLPQEKRGLVPTTEWYDSRWGAGRWRKGLMLNLAIGQGELLVTPLQLAMVLAEVSMDGRALRPHVVMEAKDAESFKTGRPAHEDFTADATTWAAVHEGLERVVESGTGTAARLHGVKVAGKTGTAQNPHGKDHALFACYAPADRPAIALAVVVENSGHGGSIAAPLAGRVLTELLVPDSLRRVVTVAHVQPDTSGNANAD